jgi:hypothetical protein
MAAGARTDRVSVAAVMQIAAKPAIARGVPGS